MNRIKSVFVNRHGEIRLSWMMLTAVVIYALAAVGVSEGYWYLYRTMMGVWCVTAENIARAPGWVQFLYSWSNVIVQLLQSMLLMLGAALMIRLTGQKKQDGWEMKKAARGAGLAAGCIGLIWLILLAVGSVRMGWKLTRPAFSLNTIAIILTSAAAALAEGSFFYGAIYGTMKKRLPLPAALAAVAIFNALMSGSFFAMGLINSLLTAVLCCLLVERSGVWMAVGFRFAWAFLDRAVFGFAGSAAALYESYPVNLYWLSGGNGGIMNGVITTAALIAVICLLNREIRLIRLPGKKRSKSPS